MKKLEMGRIIKESALELQLAERRLSKGMLRDRVRLLRVLREEPAVLLAEAARRVGGYKKSWAYGVFALYRREGLEGVTAYRLKGRQSRLTKDQEQQLKEQVAERGGVSSLKAAAQLIEESTGVSYCTSGVWFVLRGLGIKKKTGRPSHIHKDEAKVEVFKKKTFPA